MESLERQLSLILFTDGFAMPVPVVEFVRTLCHSESGLLLSKFAVATLALGLYLHAREFFVSVKQFLDEVNSLSDRFTAMVDGGEECLDLAFPVVHDAPPQLLELEETLPGPGKVMAEDLGAEVHVHTTRQSSDKIESAFRNMKIPDSIVHADSVGQDTRAEQSFGVTRDIGPIVLQTTRNSQRVINTSGNTSTCEANQDANTPAVSSSSRPSGSTKCPIEALEVLYCSETQPDLETLREVLPSSSVNLPTHEMLDVLGDSAATSSTITQDGQETRHPSDIPTGISAESIIEALDSSVTADQDRTFVDSESSPEPKDRMSFSTYDVFLTGIDALAPAPGTNTSAHARQEALENGEQEQLQVSSSSSSSLALCDDNAAGYNTSLLPSINDQTMEPDSESRGHITASESMNRLAPASLGLAKPTEDSMMFEAAAISDSTAVISQEIIRRGRRDSRGATRELRGSSISSRTLAPAHLPAPIRIAENMRRRALDLMEESHKLKDSSLCMIFEHMNPDYDVHSVAGLVRLDLHNQPAEEAVMLTRLHLDFCRRVYAERTEIITGRGRHSKGGVSVLRPLVRKELSQHPDVLVSDTNPNPGSFIVAFAQLEMVEGDN